MDNSGNQSSEVPPAGLENLLVNFFGQTFGEIKKLDQNIVGTTNNLQQKSNNFLQLAEKEINQIKVPKPVGDMNVSYNVPQQPVPNVSQTLVNPNIDSDQLEFDFTESKVKNIEKKLDDIYSKLTSVQLMLEQLMENK